jgi:hypothetical protein
MKTTIGELRRVIGDVMSEIGSLSGKLRPTKDGGRQYKIGKIEDENRELSVVEAERMFPGSTDAWAEIVPEMYPDFPFTDPKIIKQRSAWFKIGSDLRVAFADMPQIELMQWSPERQDWFDLGEGAEDDDLADDEFDDFAAVG